MPMRVHYFFVRVQLELFPIPPLESGLLSIKRKIDAELSKICYLLRRQLQRCDRTIHCSFCSRGGNQWRVSKVCGVVRGQTHWAARVLIGGKVGSRTSGWAAGRSRWVWVPL